MFDLSEQYSRDTISKIGRLKMLKRVDGKRLFLKQSERKQRWAIFERKGQGIGRVHFLSGKERLGQRNSESRRRETRWITQFFLYSNALSPINNCSNGIYSFFYSPFISALSPTCCYISSLCVYSHGSTLPSPSP